MENLLLTAKFQPPNLPSDFIFRKELFHFMNEDVNRPLTLVSAAAGFGKSTFISSWFKELSQQKAWLSLDKSDNDLRNFLHYFVTAVGKTVEGFGENILGLLHTSQLPPVEILSNSLINALSDLTHPFVLVLDDFHIINNKDIFYLIASLLKYPPSMLHLVLITRTDPPLPLARLRAANKMKDIRALHLQLNEDEIKVFIEKHLQLENIDNIAKILADKLEGWITGLRLAMLNLSFYGQNGKDVAKMLMEINFSEEYFVEEILQNQDTDAKDFLLKTSILDKFSADLAEHLLDVPHDKADGERIIRNFLKQNLFIINLDNQSVWYRYHHLFQALLQKELEKKYSKDTILKLHKRAFDWYESHKLLEEAFYHALESESFEDIALLVERHMYNLLNKDKWYVMDKWLQHIPPAYIKRIPALLIAQMWNLQNKTLIGEIAELLPLFDELSKRMEIDDNLKTLYQFFKAIILYWSPKLEDIRQAARLFIYVNENLSDEMGGMKGVSANYFICAAQASGEGEQAKVKLDRILFNGQRHITYRILVAGGIIIRELIAGNLDSALSYTKILFKLAEKSNDTFALTWNNYFVAYIYFQQNRIEKAEKFFKKALENVYTLNILASVDAFAGLLFCRQQLDKREELEAGCRKLSEFVNTRNNRLFMTYADSVKAHISVLEKGQESAGKYINRINWELDGGNTVFWIEMPRITRCRLLISDNAEGKIKEALRQLENHVRFAEETRNIPLLLNSLILQTAAFAKINETENASTALLRALSIGKEGGWVRPFIENALDIYPVIAHLKTDTILEKYRISILKEMAAYIESRNSHIGAQRDAGEISGSPPAFEELSNRELDIIVLLSQRLSNNEIAEKLFISLATVKRHAVTIYQKLGVKNRRQAVQKAIEYGILTEKQDFERFY
jgi:LuxR family maltose regulon positive regulatory protein